MGNHELAGREVGGDDGVVGIGDPHGSELGHRVEPNPEVPFGSAVTVSREVALAPGLEEAEREPAVAGQERVAAGEALARQEGVCRGGVTRRENV